MRLLAGKAGFYFSKKQDLAKINVLALNTAHVLRLNKANVLALNKAESLLRTQDTISPLNSLSIDFGQVLFLGKIKACLACNKPDIKDNIPSKVTSDGLK